MSTAVVVLVAGLGAVCTMAAAGFWLWSALIEVPNNIDTGIFVMQRIGRLSSYGAIAASIAALCGLALFIDSTVKHSP